MPKPKGEKNDTSPTDMAAPDRAVSASSVFDGPAGLIGSVAPGAPADPSSKTGATVLGEMVWLLTMSAEHKHFTLGDLEWLIMPPLMLGQYRIYYDGQSPMALALWAYLSEEAERKLEKGGTSLRPDEWRTDSLEVMDILTARNREGDGSPIADALGEPKGSLWLVDLIAPLATPENRMAESIIADLSKTLFKGRRMKFHITDPETGRRTVKDVLVPL